MSNLFNEFPLRQMFDKMLRYASAEVEQLEEEDILHGDLDQSAENIVARFRFEFPCLDESRIEQDVQIQPTGSPAVQYQIRYYIPFKGEREVFRHVPITPPTSRPEGVVKGNELVVEFFELDPDTGRIRTLFDRNLRMINGYLAALQSDVDKGFNKLTLDVTRLLATRRANLERAGNMRKSLGYPLRLREDASQVAVPITRKVISIGEPKQGPSKRIEREPYLADSTFEEILGVLSTMSIVMERNPSTFARIEEPAIRDHFLVQLNGQFQGKASGETFNAAGKTDILLRDGDRNIFIAECKIWDGPKSLNDAIAQLFSYLTWRDSKAVVLMFSRRRGFSQVIKTAKEVLESHSQRQGLPAERGETGFRISMVRPDDDQRRVDLVVLLFDIPPIDQR